MFFYGGLGLNAARVFVIVWSCFLLVCVRSSDQNNQKREAEIVGVPPIGIPERRAPGVSTLDPYHTDRGVEAVDASTAYLIVKNIYTGCVTKLHTHTNTEIDLSNIMLI